MASSSSSALMPSSSSSSSSHSAMYTGEWENDVFMCFRAGDTCDGFTSDLMAALSDKQVKAFFDTVLQKTNCTDELISVLQRSGLSIVIFSEDFAGSPWCLDEVATIAQSMKDFGHLVLPVFYNVGWSDVVEDSGRYAAAIDALDATGDRKKRWRDALKEVADVAGLTSEQIKVNSELIKVIVENVTNMLNDMSPSILHDNLVGMDSRVKEVEELLALNTSEDIHIIGLWGMGGLGKTTLARRCYQMPKFSDKEEDKQHFVERVNQNWENQQGVGGLVQELYSILLSEKDLSREDLNNTNRRARLSRMRVFLVLDDVQTSSQLEQLLLGEVSDLNKLFAPGSRIIVTTRDQSVLKYAMAKTYQVECLDSDETLRLFGMFAFSRQPLPSDDWKDLSRLAVSYCKGNPLALRVLGGALFRQHRNYWRDFLAELRQIHNPDIHHVLRRSYNRLEAEEQRLFLDVACFHSGMRRSALIKYMATSYPFAYRKVHGLVYKSLLVCVSNKEDEMIEVHDLLKEMAWNIVNEQPKLENRTRLKNPDDIHKLLASHMGKTWTVFGFNVFKTVETYLEANDLKGDRTTEGICLDLSKVKEMDLEGNAFEGMDHLRFLKFWSSKSSNAFPIDKKIRLPYSGLNSLPVGLMCLHWDVYPATSLPSTFSPENLVRLIIRHSPIEWCWPGVQRNIRNLLLLDLSYCINLTALPDLSRGSNLEELILRGCKSLTELPSYVQHFDKLSSLDLRNCINLDSLPEKLDSSFLKHVDLSNCPKISHCPEIDSTELDLLDLDGTPIRMLPSAIHKLKQGATLNLCGKNISSFPNISASLEWLRLCSSAIREIDFDDHQASSELLPRFRKLELFRNSQLKTLPSNIWKMVSTELIIQGSPLIENLPEILDPVEGLTRLVVNGGTSIKSVPSSIKNLKSLLSLSFSGTAIRSLPLCIQELQHLIFLDLSYCKRLKFLSDIHKLSSLASLFLRGCQSIRFLPQVPLKLEFLDVGDCTSLESLPSNILKLMSCCRLIADGCWKLDRDLLDRVIAHLPDQAARSPRSEAIIVYSRSELPESFCYRHVYGNEECLVTVKLPAVNSSKRLVKAIAFGIVCSYSCGGFVDAQATLDCSVESVTSCGWKGGSTSEHTTIASWRFPLEILYERGTSELVYLRADNRLGGTKEAKQEDEAWYVRYAGCNVSFRLYTRAVAQDEKSVKNFDKNFRVKRCGISLVYA